MFVGERLGNFNYALAVICNLKKDVIHIWNGGKKYKAIQNDLKLQLSEVDYRIVNIREKVNEKRELF